jgi:hypothetical protein
MRVAVLIRAASWLLALGWIALVPRVEAQVIDLIPPAVAFTSPAAGATVAAGVVLRADASDASGVVSVRFFVDGEEIPNNAAAAPYWASWDTTNVSEALHVLTARAEDAAGNHEHATILVTVDRTPPALTLMSPLNLATVSNVVPISASVLDNVGIDRVWFSANGVPLGEDTTPPFGIAWDTLLLPDGSYTLQVGARDRAGSLNSAATTVTVFNNTTRVEESDPAISYSGTWAHSNAGVRPWNGGTASFNTLTQFAAQANFNFDGTGVTWIGFRGPQAGIARVYLDGVQIATVDLYHPVELVRTPVFNVTGLPFGSHTLIVEATGTWNPLSTDPFVVVDTFIVNQH